MNVARHATALAIILGLGLPAWSWDTTTELALVVTSTRLISKEGSIPLNRLAGDIRAGASVSDEELHAIIPISDIDPLGAIEVEMKLLQSVKPAKIDHYYAYRLGVMGKLVARISSPMNNAPSGPRSRYFTDATGKIEQLNIIAKSRQLVDPGPYFTRVIADASAQDEIISKDYEIGINFDGVAGAALRMDTSRTVNAVSDVWYTVLVSRSVVAGVPDIQRREYVLGGLAYYIDRGSPGEITSAYERLSAVGIQGTDMRKRIGDMFFDAELYEQAIGEYRAVLASDPGRRDVSTRLSQYFEALGDAALLSSNLEDARDAFTSALEYDKLHVAAEKKLLDTEAQIRQRAQRMAAATEALATADALRDAADNLALQGESAEAISRLDQAMALYATVPEEFPRLSSQARVRWSAVAAQINELRGELATYAASLSGSGSGAVSRQAAMDASKILNTRALRALVEKEYNREVDALESDLRKRIVAGP
jgi:tetratricopeptide (TPR) repeat protein